MENTKRVDYIKKIEYSNFEFISIFVITILLSLITNIPKEIISISKEGSIISMIFICIVATTAYYFITKSIFKNNDNFLQVINKTYHPIISKIIGIMLFIFCILLIYLILVSMINILKTTTYALSSNLELALYFLVAIYLIANKGFSNIFKIAGYTSALIVIYLLIVMIADIPKMNPHNMLPVFGSGLKDIFITNFKNIYIFAPIFFVLLFNNNIDKSKNRDKKNNVRNVKKIMIITSLMIILMIATILFTFHPSLIETTNSVIIDINRIISFSTVSLQTTPILIFLYSFIVFISTSFITLTSVYILENLKVIKNYKKVLNITIFILFILMVLPDSYAIRHIISGIFIYVTLFVVYILPIVTIILNKILKKEGLHE